MKRQAVETLKRSAGDPVYGPVMTFAGAVAGYVLLAACAYQLIGASSGVASFWPPNGLIVALLVLLAPKSRPWVIAAVLPGELIADAMQGYPVLTALGWGASNIVETMLAAWILLAVARGRPRGNRGRDFVAVALAAVVAPLAGGLFGGVVSVASFGGDYGTAWLNWWLGDATGIMLVASLVIAFAEPDWSRTPLQQLAAVVEVGLLLGTAIVVFATTKLPLEFLVLPPLVLLAVQQGTRLTAVACVSFAIIATICTGHGLGPLSQFPGAEARALGLQAFTSATAFVGLLLGGAISERRHAEAALAHLANHDPLTGIANRRHFLERLDQTAARQGRSREGAAIAYFDLDGFKTINDRFGHGAGDAVLVEVGRRLEAAIRATDAVARIGGDEFAVLLEPVDGKTGADLAARRIAAAVEQPFTLGDFTVPIGISVGAALVNPDIELTLTDADRRLYRDKADSHARYVDANHGELGLTT